MLGKPRDKISSNKNVIIRVAQTDGDGRGVLYKLETGLWWKCRYFVPTTTTNIAHKDMGHFAQTHFYDASSAKSYFEPKTCNFILKRSLVV